MQEPSQQRHNTFGKRSHWETVTLKPDLPTYYGDKGSHQANTSRWLRKLSMLGRLKLGTVVSTVALVAIIYLVFRYMAGAPSLGLVRQRQDDRVDEMSERDISRYLSNIEDTRPSQCGEGFASNDLAAQISILIDYKDEEFYDLKLTLHSIIKHTPEYLLKEIILLDDGSTKSHVKAHAAKYLKDSKFNKLKAYRSDKNEGQAASRYKAAMVAEGSVLVFLSSRVVVNQGWLEPLVKEVFRSDTTIAVPHHDNFLPGYRFFRTDNNLVNTFTWALTTVYTESEEDTTHAQTLVTPVMRGDVFAVTKDLYEELGAYDDQFSVGGGHDLEMSLRTWMCGGEIKVALCSRVAVHSTMKPLQIDSERNFQRVVELWFDDFKPIAYKQSGANSLVSGDITQSVSHRQGQLRHVGLKCKPFSWYLNKIVPFLLVPNQNMMYFGKLKVTKTLYCPRSVGDASPALDLVLCRPHVYDASMIFEMDDSGHIRTGDRCMAVADGERVLLEQCRPGQGHQQWELTTAGKLVNKSRWNRCVTQETERDTNGVLEHYMAMRDCAPEDDRKQGWSFINY